MQASALALSTKDMTRIEWLDQRRKGIGGSDAAAIMGANPFCSPLAVYFDKLGFIPEQETTEAMRQGIDLESYVADRFCEETGLKARRVNRMLQHPDHPWMLANIDRSIAGKRAGLECKTTSVFNKSDFGAGVVPETYLWQCMHYLAVTNLETWYLAVLILNKAFHVFEIQRDDALIKTLIERERAFWFDNVMAGIPPLPCGSEADDNLIGSVIAHAGGGDAPVDLSGIQQVLETIPYAKANLDQAERRYEAARQQVRLALGGADSGFCGKWSVSNRYQARTDLDKGALQQEHPETYSAYLKTTRYKVLRIKEGK